jgi:endonuclease-3 related protein
VQSSGKANTVNSGKKEKDNEKGNKKGKGKEKDKEKGKEKVEQSQQKRILKPLGLYPPHGKKAEQRIMEIYKKLRAHFGALNWWPGDDPFEVMIGAILTQNTAWRNVEKAIANLKAKGLITPERLKKADPKIIKEALLPSGYFNIKTDRILHLVDFILANGKGGSIPQILLWPMDKLRNALLNVKGIGPETADSIVLYAAGYPSFVVDAYTKRLLVRHFYALGTETYDEIRNYFMLSLPPDSALFNDLHALIVAIGHNFCVPKGHKCHLCPLGQDPHLLPSLASKTS